MRQLPLIILEMLPAKSMRAVVDEMGEKFFERGTLTPYYTVAR